MSVMAQGQETSLAGVTAAKDFVASGVACGIRSKGLDLAIVHSLRRATGAAMFTVNRVQAAPVVVCKEHLELGEPQAVVINSGCANAATGERGLRDARTTAAGVAGLLRLAPQEVLVLSTGVVGEPLPLAKVLGGVASACRELSPAGGDGAADAILTTDTHAKVAVAHGDGFTVGGMAKGAGMIHPNMATMLAVLTTDYPLERGEAIEFLRPAVDESFNSISVDGECSTNDTVVLLANGASEIERTTETDEAFAVALKQACADLARQIVADGEGATLVVDIDVTGAASNDEAKAIATRIATSPLVKTALFGRDANWGRVACAAGSAPVDGGYAQLDPDLLTIRYSGTTVLELGVPTNVEPDVSDDELTIEIDLGLGDGRARYTTCDYSYDYIRINGEYRT
jgi:glutamate N-acetyltransferase / amino-acid N-acetyltransferase